MPAEGAADGVADGDFAPSRAGALSPRHPQEGEAILWEGRPTMLARKALELVGFLLLLALLSWLALELIRPHLAGSEMAGHPDATSALPLILAMVAGMVLIIALPVWLRSSARARARYMLTNRRALVWLGNRIVGEAVLFGSEMRSAPTEVSFTAPHLWLDWRLKDEGQDRIRFEQIPDAQQVAELAEQQGARWQNPPTESRP